MSYTIQQIQSVVDNIRLAILNGNYDDTPEMREQAQEFHELSRFLNQRLQQCSELLRQGLRGEALREADSEPQLLEAVSVVCGLTEEDRDEWSDACSFMELPAPEPILEEAARILDAAYEEYEPLELLVRQHRRLALQRAPLSKRLSVLRALRKKDPDTEFWEQDVLLYEQARHAQIAEEVGKLKKSPSSEKLHALKQEIESEEWSIPVSSKTRLLVDKLIKSTQLHDSRVAAQKAADELYRCFSELNFAAAKPAYEKWMLHEPLAKTAEHEDVKIQVYAALRWYEQAASLQQHETEWARAIKKAEALLEEAKRPLGDYEQMVDELEHFSRPIPEELSQELETRIQKLKRQSATRRWLIISGSSLATFALVGLTTVLVLRMNENRQRATVTNHIHKSVQQGNVAEAKKLLTQFHDRWHSSADWASASREVERLEDLLENRMQRIHSILEEARNIPDHDDALFLKAKEDGLAIANETPVVASFVNELTTGFHNLTSQRTERLKQLEKNLLDRLQIQEEQLLELTKAASMLEEGQFNSRIAQVKESLKTIQQEGAGTSQQVESRVQNFISQSDELSRVFFNRTRQQKLHEQLSKLVLSRQPDLGKVLKEYSALLEQLAEVTTDQTSLSQIQYSLELMPALESIASFQQLFAKTSNEIFPTDSLKISEAIAAVSKFLEEHPTVPMRPVLVEYSAALGVFEKRYHQDNSLLDRVRAAAIRDLSMRDLYIVKVKGQKWPYYVTAYREFSDKGIVELQLYRQDRQPRPQRLNAATLESTKTEEAPQRKLALKFSDALDKMEYHNWEETFSSMSKHVLSAGDVDPILKLRLLVILQRQAQDGSLVLSNHEPFLNYIQELADIAQSVNLLTQWPEPLDEEVASRRKEAELYVEKMNSLTSFDALWMTSRNQLADLEKLLSRKYICVGWMRQGASGKPVLEIELPNEKSWNLVTCHPGDDKSSPFRFQQIGRAESGQYKIEENALKSVFYNYGLVFAHPQESH